MSISSWALCKGRKLVQGLRARLWGWGQRGLSLSLLADEGRWATDTGNSCFPNSEEGQLYLAPGHWGLKASHSSGVAPSAAEPRLVCFLGQDSPCCQWGPGQPQQCPGVSPNDLSILVLRERVCMLQS